MNTVKIIFITILAYVIATAVVLSSLHVRDIIGNSNNLAPVDTARTIKTNLDEVTAKAIGDLHSHVDKTMLKMFVKSISDPATIARQRDLLDEHNDIDRPLSVIMLEMLLMFRLTYAFTLAR